VFLYSQKTGVPVRVPLPDFVLEAISGCGNEEYFPWSGIRESEELRCRLAAVSVSARDARRRAIIRSTASGLFCNFLALKGSPFGICCPFAWKF